VIDGDDQGRHDEGGEEQPREPPASQATPSAELNDLIGLVALTDLLI